MLRLTLVPFGGLCNRLTAIASAVALARQRGARLRVLWCRKSWCACRFEDLFRPLPADVALRSVGRLPLLMERNLPRNLRSMWRVRRMLGWRSIDDFQNLDGRVSVEGRVPADGRVYISSCMALIPDYSFEGLFRPIKALQRRIDALTRTFTSPIYGVHIRRGDHTTAMAHSPVAAFRERMHALLRDAPQATFYLATDDADVKAALQAELGAHVVCNPPARLSRSTVEGMQDAVVDLWCLAATDKILGSYNSSFSIVASRLGGKELEIVTS